MNDNTAIDIRNLAEVRKAGLDALERELGPVGMVYFLRLYSNGNGDYTTEREQLLKGITFDEIVKGAREIEKSRE